MSDGQAAAPAAPAPAPQSQDMRGVPEPVARIQAILNAEKAPQEPAPQAQPAAPQEQQSGQQ